MNQGVTTIIYPVADLATAKAMFTRLLGIEPYADAPYYVGYRIGNQEIGLDPNTHKAGMTAYYHVDDIHQSLQALLDAGAQIVEGVTNAGPARLRASVRDAGGSIIGLLQDK